MDPLPLVNPQGTDSEMLDHLLSETLTYFVREHNETNGLIADRTEPGSYSSIAAIGLGLSCYIVAAKRGLLERSEVLHKVAVILRFFRDGKQGPEPDAMGHNGFYYHFLDMKTGRRAGGCELSTVDTALFIAGVLAAGTFFGGDQAEEREIRDIADFLYKRINWSWALNGSTVICHGWSPEGGFLPYYWDRDYSEALLLYMLAMGSPTFPIPNSGYNEWAATFRVQEIYGIRHLYAGPMFIHQLSHIWIDFRGIRDDFCRKTDMDYFENSRRATYVQQKYAVENKNGFAHYGNNCWGFTASDGPGNSVLLIDGIQREFYGYLARGAPFGPDDGTVSPWAVVASLPFAPEIVLDTIRHAIERLDLKSKTWYGFDASFNPTYPAKSKNPNGWVSPWKFGLNEGPIILMIENYQSELIWNIMKNCPYIRSGLSKAGFQGGWL
jgi:hypothetical protein